MKKLSKDDKRIIREDIGDLKFLISKYNKEKKYDKARQCEMELDNLQKELKGDKNANENL